MSLRSQQRVFLPSPLKHIPGTCWKFQAYHNCELEISFLYFMPNNTPKDYELLGNAQRKVHRAHDECSVYLSHLLPCLPPPTYSMHRRCRLSLYGPTSGGVPGVCGDPFKPYAKSGTPESDFFGKPCDPIVTYEEGQIIDLEVNLNVNHGGNFEFKLCDQPGGAFPDQSCFDAHILKRCACAHNKCSVSKKHKEPWLPITYLKRVSVYMSANADQLVTEVQSQQR